MIIQSPDPVPKTVHDYDFLFTTGYSLQLTLDLEQDRITNEDGFMIVEVAEKTFPGIDFTVPPEAIVIYKAHLLTSRHSTRQVVPATPEQNREWYRTIQEMSRSPLSPQSPSTGTE